MIQITYFKISLAIFCIIMVSMSISADNSATSEEWIEMADNYYSEKNYSGTLDAADKALLLDSELERAWNLKSAAHRNLKQYDEAIEAAEHAIALNDSYSAPWYNIAESLNKLDRYEDALEAYEKSIVLNDNYVFSWIGKSYAFINLGRYNEALDAAEEAIRLDNTSTSALNNKAAALSGLHKYEEALAAAEQALTYDKEYPYGWSNKAAALIGLKKYEEGLESLEKSLDLHHNSSFIWENKGLAFEALGKKSEAIEAYTIALQLNPLDEQSRTHLKDLTESDKTQESGSDIKPEGYLQYNGSLFQVEYPDSSEITETTGSIKFQRNDPPYSMTVGLTLKDTSYSNIEEFIESWTNAFEGIYEVTSVRDVKVGDIPAEQFIVSDKNGDIIMISTIFWEYESPHIISTGGGANTLTNEEQHFLATYKNNPILPLSDKNTDYSDKNRYDGENFSFEYLQNWNIDESDPSKVILEVPDFNVYIGIVGMDSTDDLSDFISRFKNNVKKDSLNFKEFEEKTMESSQGYPIEIFEYTDIYKGKLTHYRNYVIASPDKKFLLSLIYRPEEGEDIKDFVDELMSTFSISE